MTVLTLEQNADKARARGELHAAAELYKRLLKIAPDHVKADRLLSSITGCTSALPAEPGGLKPAPFLIVDDFLPAEIHDALLKCLWSKAGEFVPAQTMSGLRREYRRSMVLPGGLSHIDPGIQKVFYGHLLAHWPAARIRLRIPPFEGSISEMHVLLYGDGDFFARHRDTGRDNTRRMTFIYNLHRMPRLFRGGDLLLYDTVFVPGRGNFAGEMIPLAEAYTRLLPEDNRLVFFPSEFFHEVTPVTNAGDDVSNARLAINGWVHTSRESGDLNFISLTPY